MMTCADFRKILARIYPAFLTVLVTFLALMVMSIPNPDGETLGRYLNIVSLNSTYGLLNRSECGEEGCIKNICTFLEEEDNTYVVLINDGEGTKCQESSEPAFQAYHNLATIAFVCFILIYFVHWSLCQTYRCLKMGASLLESKSKQNPLEECVFVLGALSYTFMKLFTLCALGFARSEDLYATSILFFLLSVEGIASFFRLRKMYRAL